MSPSGQTPAPSTAAIDAFAASAIQALGPILQRDIIPQVLGDRQALTILGSEAGKAAVREAGPWGVVASIGIGSLGIGVLMIGTSQLIRAIRRQ